ncbi:RING finger protein 207 isoform X1 [Tribolium castaneum]|uniref:RING finger protein 207 n=4 Tax=Tenebrionidae TaxID=7065 RepID=D2A6E1_TRICA|nr:PREDICTED: RING finger protein 207 isoform X1 [Tribolium castaneum]EFA04936.1 RING finger protein 207-like Protein [Tribolium castaneum]|eukprot:XP_008194880.1 PREDICTED: RING finger protein 207 isoform X1 [Tribolium castaneum]
MEPPGMETIDFPKNPLLCPICHDYFTEPCILSCYHTFCARCLRGREQDRRLVCPFCRQPTLLKDGSMLPPPDSLMRQLIDIANSENPPCSNCDKRDRANMYYCNTCGQALCSHCRDNTHRAKMFSSHDIVHMTKCTKEPKRCPQHGEQYIMYSPLQNNMLCVNCFRDLPNEIRAQCVDIDTAHSQAAKRLERGQNAIMDLQTSVRDGIIALKSMMDELRRNMDSEKHTINTFCQGMQEAMAKTHAAMIMEVQRQYESKDRIYRSQLLVLGTVMPVLQLHLVLCTTFTAAANKYQFLELCPSLLERLSAVGQLSQPVRSLQSSTIKTNYRSEFAQCLEPWIGPAAVTQHQSEVAAASRMYDSAPPATKKQQTALKNKVLEGDSSFSAHCRSFESQIRDLNQQFNVVKEKVSDLHRDITALRKAQAPPLAARYDMLMRECLHLEQNLERQQQELDRMAENFDASWEEQLWRLRVEQEVFSCQRADVMTLRNELKHISQLVGQLEPYIRSLTPAQQSESAAEHSQQMQTLLDHFNVLQQSDASLGKIPRSRSRVLGQLFEKVRPNIQERERSKSAGQTDKPLSTPLKPKKPFIPSTHQMNIERLEAHLKEKIHEMVCRRQSSSTPQSKSDPETERKLSKTDLDSISKLGTKQRIMYKKIGKSCDKINTCSKSDGDVKKRAESDYQRISEATSQSVKALVHKETRSSPSSPKCKGKPKPPPKQRKTPKVYPYSDGEDNVFYSLHDSADSMSTSSRRSSFEGPDKTLVVVINKRSNNMTMAQKQRSWETFPPKRRHHMCHKLSAPNPMPLRKADSFEGHEEAVKSLVAAVQETRRKPKGGN